MSDETKDQVQSAAAEGEKHSAELSPEDMKQVVGGAQGDYFLKIDGIKGESQDDKHKD